MFCTIRHFFIRRFVPFGYFSFDILSRSAFFPFSVFSIRCFLLFNLLSQSTFFPFNVLSHSAFFPFNVLSHSAFCLSTFCRSMFCTFGVCYFDILSVNRRNTCFIPLLQGLLLACRGENMNSKKKIYNIMNYQHM